MNQFFDSIASRLSQVLDPSVLGDRMAGVAVRVMVAAVVLVLAYGLWLMVGVALRVSLRGRLDNTTETFVRVLVKYGILALGILYALDAAGVPTAAALTSVGVFGLTIGFASRDALSNLIAGVLIYLDRPFVLDDLVEIDGKYGRVDRITLRSTRVVTPDGRMLAVPNTEIINKTVVSYTNFPHLRIEVPVTVGTQETLPAVRGHLLALVRDDPDYLDEPPPEVVVTELGDYNVTLELRAWLDDERKHANKRPELRERIFEALTEAGVDMPFETFRLAPVDVRVGGRSERS